MNPAPPSFTEFVRSLTAQDRVGILFDGDPDGLSSAVITAHAIEQLTGKKPGWIFTQGKVAPQIRDSTLETAKAKKISHLICLDISLDQQPADIRKAEKFMKVLIIDHHKKYHEMDSKQTTMVKSIDISPMEGAKYPTAKLAYDLFSSLTDITPFSWVACIGLTGDNSVIQWKEFMDEQTHRHRVSFDELFALAEMISAVEAIENSRLNSLVQEFFNAKTPKEMMSSEFFALKNRLETELGKLETRFREKKEEFPKEELIIFIFDHPLKLKSMLANRVSHQMFPDKTVLIGQTGGEFIYFSARRQDGRIAVNDLMEKACEGLPDAGGGGHKPAAAAKIRKTDLNVFRERILAELRNNSRTR
ncbi:MAG: DHH family phosphoesterase [Candidatus Diapherotrites archaeon]|nr:DHH family phosphoesterase [Candidatus Diapherotrites archaeon]